MQLPSFVYYATICFTTKDKAASMKTALFDKFSHPITCHEK